MIRDDRKYAESHEWVKLDGDAALVGISDHAQESLGDITFVELPSAGTEVKAGMECGVIESLKAASDIYAPVSGTVSAVNTSLESEPERINKSPYDDGWMLKISGVVPAALGHLMDAAAYEAFLKTVD